MAETWVELNEYLKMLFNMNRCGDLLVIGMSILENIDDGEQKNVKLDSVCVKKSIEYLLKRHALLRAQIERVENKVFFKLTKDDASRGEVIEGKDLVFHELSSRREMIMELENLTKKLMDYDNKCKLWRAGLFSFHDEQDNGKLKYAVAFLLPLYMTDALNITALSVELANLINAVLSGVECEEMRTVMPCVESELSLIVKDNLIGPRQLKFLEEKKKLDLGRKFKLDAKFASQKEEKGSKINIFRINKIRSKSLTTKCKKHGVKFTGFLMAAIFYSIKDLYIENGLEAPKELCACISINMRFRYKKPVDYSSVGYFSGLIPIEVEYPKFGQYENIWTDSKYWDEIIHESTDLESGAIFVDICDYELHKEINRLFETSGSLEEVCHKMQSSSRWDVFVSNIGTYLCNKKRQEPTKPFALKEIYYADSLNSSPSRDNSLIFHLGLWNDELMFMNTSDKARIAPRFTDRLMGLLEGLLNDLADKSD